MIRSSSENSIDRRILLKTLAGISLLSLVELPMLNNSLHAKNLDLKFENWLIALHELNYNLRKKEISTEMWKTQIAGLIKNVDTNQLLKMLDFENLKQKANYDQNGMWRLPITFEKPKRAKKVKFGKQIFGFKKGALILPHAHNDMVSLHMVVNGSFRLKTFDRDFSKERPGFLYITESQNRDIKKGDMVLMSETKDNIHWFKALEEGSFTFNIPIGRLNKKLGYINHPSVRNRVFVDPHFDRSGQHWVAKVLSKAEAVKKFS